MLKNLSVSMKLWLILIVSIAGLSANQLYSLYALKAELLDSRQTKIKELVETAYSLIEGSYQQLGDTPEARAQAKELVRRLGYAQKGYFWINDENLILVMHPKKPAKEGKDMTNVRDGDGQLHWQAMRNIVLSQGEGLVNYSYLGPKNPEPQPKISYVKGFKPWGWVVGTGVYVNDLNAHFWNRASVAIGVAVASTLAVAVLIMMIARNIIQPVQALSTPMAEAAEGRLRNRIKERRRDEFGALGEAFNNMLAGQTSLISQLSDACGQLTSTASTLLNTTDSTQQGVQRQFEEVDQLATAMDEMSSTIHEVAHHATQTADATRQASDEAEDGKHAVTGAIESIQQLAQEVESTADSLKQLDAQCHEIGAVVEVIETISEQTNLLALNAAIEAARAGDQGRGFSVVADEVRSLAMRTQQSTVEIQTMIQNLQNGAQQAVAVMNRSMQKSGDSVERAQQAGEVLNRIVDQVQTINDMSTQIATAAEEQSAVSDEMTRGLHQIRDVSSETSEGAETMASNSRELNRMVSTFQRSIGRFEV
ncbi:MAG: methyl-accepting chemotaxis protein [Marinobacterium sp.]|nr:methyl-accepting chemotaxis protein [Marinobacterium sp.]